ncbi:MAG: hypothetical protein ABI325_02240, partial [Ginsengibacter sp.]
AIKKFIDVLAQDHLIKKDTYSVAVEKGELYIDGDKQPEDITGKYGETIVVTGDFITKEMHGGN